MASAWACATKMEVVANRQLGLASERLLPSIITRTIVAAAARTARHAINTNSRRNRAITQVCLSSPSMKARRNGHLLDQSATRTGARLRASITAR